MASSAFCQNHEVVVGDLCIHGGLRVEILFDELVELFGGHSRNSRLLVDCHLDALFRPRYSGGLDVEAWLQAQSIVVRIVTVRQRTALGRRAEGGK